MCIRLMFVLLLSLTLLNRVNAVAVNDIDRKVFYDAVKSGNLASVDNVLALLPSSGLKNTEAFEGTLLMKKAGLVSMPKNKLDLFKKGRTKLEGAIQKDSLNAEYRFMRLMIQEHTPKIVKYQGELSADAGFIEKNFRNLSPELQAIVIDYSKQSKTLSTAKLQ